MMWLVDVTCVLTGRPSWSVRYCTSTVLFHVPAPTPVGLDVDLAEAAGSDVMIGYVVVVVVGRDATATRSDVIEEAAGGGSAQTTETATLFWVASNDEQVTLIACAAAEPEGDSPARPAQTSKWSVQSFLPFLCPMQRIGWLLAYTC